MTGTSVFLVLSCKKFLLRWIIKYIFETGSIRGGVVSLRRKFIFILSVAFIIFVAGYTSIHFLIILPSMRSIEDAGARNGCQRTIGAIEREIEHLDEICRDWASWDETYRFMVDHNRDYIVTNLTEGTIASLKLVCMYYVDPQGKIIWGGGFDPEKKVFTMSVEFSPGKFPVDRLLPVYHGRNGIAFEEKRNGLFLSESGPLMLCARPVLTSNGEGPARGTVIMARKIDSPFMRQITSMTDVGFNIYPVNDKNIDKKLAVIIHQLGAGQQFLLKRESGRIIHYSLINDISRRSQLLLETSQPRVISRKHYYSMTFALFFTIVIVLAEVTIFAVIFETQLFHPLSFITSRISDITELGDLTQRMGMDRNDEIGVLSHAFDDLIERLHDAGSRLMEDMERIKVEMEIRRKVEEMLTEANSKLDELASTDGLTGLLNRRKFDEEMRRLWRHSKRSGEPLSIIICDVDFFKMYNDTYGHQAGDACLQSISSVISSTFKRPLDVAARYGGEEFIIALPETDQDVALALAINLLKSVQELDIRHETSVVAPYVTISAGLATDGISDDTDAEKLIRIADRALYRAKDLGRNRVESAI